MKKKILIFLISPLLFCQVTMAQQKDKWVELKTKNKIDGRSECGLAAVNGQLYLIGGDGPAAAVEVYDPATLNWSERSKAPIPMHHIEAVSLNDKIYVLDAFYKGEFPNQDPAPNAYSYDTKTDQWKELAGLPVERRRAGAGAAAYHGKLYLVAGIKHGHSSGTNSLFDVYDPETNTWTALPDAPHIRDHSQAVVVGDKLYAIGGRNTSYHEPDNFMSFFSKTVLEVDCYEFKTGKWSVLLAKLPMGTGGGTAVNLDGNIYYIGGERATATTPNGSKKDVYELNASMPVKWNKVADVNIARNGVGSAVLNHHIYIAGGAAGGPPPSNNGGKHQGPPQGPPPGPRPGGNPQGIALEVFSAL